MRRSSLFVSSSAFNTWLLSAQGERGKGNLFKNSSLRDAGSARGRHFVSQIVLSGVQRREKIWAQMSVHPECHSDSRESLIDLGL